MPTEHVPASRTLGIGLASQPPDTAACVMEWGGGPGQVVELVDTLADYRLVELMTDPAVAKVAIDALFGWPLAFIDTIATYRGRGTWLPLDHEERGSEHNRGRGRKRG